MPVVNYSGKNTQTFREKGPLFRFLPGANEVPQAVWDDLQKNSSVQNFIARGVLKVVTVFQPKAAEGKGPGKLAKVGEKSTMTEAELASLDEADIGSMDAWAAIALVEGVIDLGHLRRFNEQEEERKGGSRKTVLAALKAQIEAMEITEPTSKE